MRFECLSSRPAAKRATASTSHTLLASLCIIISRHEANHSLVFKDERAIWRTFHSIVSTTPSHCPQRRKDAKEHGLCDQDLLPGIKFPDFASWRETFEGCHAVRRLARTLAFQVVITVIIVILLVIIIRAARNMRGERLRLGFPRRVSRPPLFHAEADRLALGLGRATDSTDYFSSGFSSSRLF